MTDDWHKSLLYKNLISGTNFKLPMTEQEMTITARKPPREPSSIKVAINKGITILRSLLMEMLGTKEDMERFEVRFSVYSPGHARALMEKCLSLLSVKNMTVDIIMHVIKRENLMRSLEVSNNRVKEKVVKVYNLNKIIREKILRWVNDENVPFEKFIFKDKEYMQKISEDSVVLQGYLASPYILYTQYQ